MEAGRIDGLSELGLFFRIYMPTMKSTYATAIITFLNSWNNYLWPLIVAVAGEYDRAALISNLGSGYAPDYGLIMSAIVITTRRRRLCSL